MTLDLALSPLRREIERLRAQLEQQGKHNEEVAESFFGMRRKLGEVEAENARLREVVREGDALRREVERLTAERDEARNTCRECGEGRPGWTVEPHPGSGEPMQVQCRTCDERQASAESRLSSLTAEYAALGKVVKEWQEAKKAVANHEFGMAHFIGGDPEGAALLGAERSALAALASHPLKEDT